MWMIHMYVCEKELGSMHVCACVFMSVREIEKREKRKRKRKREKRERVDVDVLVRRSWRH